MAVTANFFGQGIRDVASGTINLNANTFGAMLTAGYAWNQDTHHYRSDVTNEVPTGTGYTYGGATLTGATITYDAASNETRWDWADPSWPTSSFSASQMVVFKRRGGTSAADELIMYIEFGGTQTVSSGTFTYQVPATGAGVITSA
jgi:hypothetical protein